MKKGLLILTMFWWRPCVAQHNTAIDDMCNALELCDTTGEKYKATILSLDATDWNAVATIASVPLNNKLVKGATALYYITVQETRPYICALPLRPGQQHIPRFGPSILTTQFSIEGPIAGSRKRLAYSGSEWAPVSVYLYAPDELWLQVKKIVVSNAGHRNTLAGRSYYIRILLPFDK